MRRADARPPAGPGRARAPSQPRSESGRAQYIANGSRYEKSRKARRVAAQESQEFEKGANGVYAHADGRHCMSSGQRWGWRAVVGSAWSYHFRSLAGRTCTLLPRRLFSDPAARALSSHQAVIAPPFSSHSCARITVPPLPNSKRAMGDHGDLEGSSATLQQTRQRLHDLEALTRRVQVTPARREPRAQFGKAQHLRCRWGGSSASNPAPGISSGRVRQPAAVARGVRAPELRLTVICLPA